MTGAVDCRSFSKFKGFELHSHLREFHEYWDRGWAKGTYLVVSPRLSADFLHPWKGSVKRDWKIIYALGYQDVYNELGDPDTNVHRLENVMTLCSLAHDYFNRLEMWFEPTVNPSKYLFPRTYKWITPRILQTRTKCAQVGPPFTC